MKLNSVQLTVVRKMVIGFASLATLLVFTSFLTYFGLQDIKGSADKVVNEKMPLQRAMSEIQSQFLTLSNLTSNAYYEDDANAVSNSLELFKKAAEEYKLNEELVRLQGSDSNKVAIDQALTLAQTYLDNSLVMFERKLSLISVLNELETKSEIALNHADEASALMMDLSYLEGDSRDLETLIGVSTKVDNQLGLILPILKELQSTSDPELSAASIDDVSYNLSNIEADQSYMNRLAEGVETDGLLELFNEEIEKLKQTLGGESGLFVIQNRKIELYALAAESKQQINQALTQTISQITSLNKQVSADTLQGQQDILDTVSSNTVQNMLVSVFGVGATIGFAFIATRSIAKPLARVNKRLKIIASGDLTKRMTDDGNDEFSELSRNVNRLIDSLQTLIGSIHTQEETLTQITQRSIELGSANLELVATQQSQIETTSENTQSIKQTSLNNLSQIKMANDQISKAIDQSAHVVGLVEQSKNQVNQQAIQASNSATIIHRLGENSRRIGGILDVIKTIAEQTNLLALNAAIEAARAGEQGRGFAVVADEVRTLATRTHKSTEEIEEMITALQKDADQAVSAINESSEQVQKGVEITESVTEQVIQIKEIIQALSQVNNKIVEDTESQDGLLNDVYINLQNVVDLSKKAANSTHETNDATREMGVQMSSLKQAVDRFKL